MAIWLVGPSMPRSARAAPFWSEAPIPIAIGAMAIGLCLLVIAMLWRRRARVGANARGPGPVRSLGTHVLPAAGAVAIATLIVVSIVQVHGNQEAKELARLQAVAHFKASQLAAWLDERRADATFVMTSVYMPGLWAQWQDGNADARRALINRLSQISRPANYGDVLLAAADGRIVWSREAVSGTLPDRLRAAATKAAAARTIVMTGPHRDDQGRVWLDFVAPLQHVAGAPVAVVVMRADPARTLFPILDEWPTASHSAETLLVEYRDDRIVYLNQLRHSADSAARLERPLRDTRLLATQMRDAGKAAGASMRGVDYRGVEVIGAGYAVPGTTWNLITKIDLAEVRAQSRPHAWLIATLGVFSALALAGTLLLWRQRQALQFEIRAREAQTQKLRALQLLQAISDSSADAIFAKDLEGRYLLFNAEAARLSGRDAGAVVGRTDAEVFTPNEAAAFTANDRRVLAENRALVFDETVETTDRRTEFFTVKGPLRDMDGTPVGVYGIGRDVTAAREAERALRDRERKLSAIVAHSPSALSLKDPEGRYVMANPVLQRMLGLPEDRILGRTDAELFPEATARLLRAHDELALRTRTAQSLEEVIETRGSAHVHAASVFPILDENRRAAYVCRIGVDISEQRRVSAELAALAADMSSTLQAIPDLLFEIDEHGRYLAVRTTRAELLAAPADQVVGRTVRDLLPPDAAQTVMRAIEDATRCGTDYGKTILVPFAEGPRHFELSVARKQPLASRPYRFIVVSRDVTARELNAISLRQRNEELERFNRLTVGRELDMVGLKREVNDLLRELDRPPRYRIAATDPAGSSGDA